MTEKIDINDIYYNNFLRKEHIKNLMEIAEKFQKDPDKKARKKENNCIPCYYYNGMHGNNMPIKNCDFCKKPVQYFNSDVDKICLDCASKYGLCKRCGADIDLKNKRNY